MVAQAQQAIVLPDVMVGAKPAGSAKKAETAAGVASNEAVISPTSVATTSENTTSAVTVITSEQLQRTQSRTVAEALQTVPGLQVVQMGGIGGQTSVFMRGTESNHVKVLIDGIDASDASTPNGEFDFGHLMTADVERIEVLRGPQGGLYGAGAIGGVISITTRQGKGPLKVRGFVEGGSLGTFNQAVGASGSQGAFHYSFGVSHNRSTDIPVTPRSILGPGQERLPNAYDNWTYSAKVGAEVSRNLAFNWVTRYTNATLDFTEDDFPFPFTSQTTTDVSQLFTRGEAVVTMFDGAFKNYFGVSYTDQVRKNDSPSIYSTPWLQGEKVKLDWRGVASFSPGQVLVMGAETQTDTIKTRAGLFSAAIDAEQTNNAGYLELQSQIAKGLSVVANVRHDENENFGGATTWRAGAAYILPGTRTKLRASAGTGFKAPSLYELFGPYTNPDLQPEESFGYDVGFEQPLLKDKVNFGVTYFNNDIRNLIDWNSTFTQYINVDRAETSGYEFFASAILSATLQVRADYTYTEAIDATTGAPLLRRPKHKASATVMWQPLDALSTTTTLLYIGERDDFTRFAGAGVAEDYFIVNVAADYKLNETMSLFGRVDNLFDVYYQEPLEFERPGLAVYGGVRFATR